MQVLRLIFQVLIELLSKVVFLIIADLDVDVLGFTGHIDSVDDVLDDIDIFSKGFVVQLLDANGIAGRNHVFHAVNQSVLAFDRKDNFANDLGVEICLRCSAQRQISKAFSLLGLKEGDMNLCAVIVNGNNEIYDYLNSTFDRNDDVLLPVNDDLVKIFDISSEELACYTHEDIIIDKISKLVVDF